MTNQVDMPMALVRMYPMSADDGRMCAACTWNDPFVNGKKIRIVGAEDGYTNGGWFLFPESDRKLVEWLSERSLLHSQSSVQDISYSSTLRANTERRLLETISIPEDRRVHPVDSFTGRVRSDSFVIVDDEQRFEYLKNMARVAEARKPFNIPMRAGHPGTLENPHGKRIEDILYNKPTATDELQQTIQAMSSNGPSNGPSQADIDEMVRRAIADGVRPLQDRLILASDKNEELQQANAELQAKIDRLEQSDRGAVAQAVREEGEDAIKSAGKPTSRTKKKPTSRTKKKPTSRTKKSATTSAVTMSAPE